MTAIAIPRDARVDQIGFVDELEKHYATRLRGLVKERMSLSHTEQVEADFFAGLLVSGGLTTSVPPARLVDLYDAGEIDREQLISALTVRIEPLKKFLSLDAIDAIAEKTRTTPRLFIKRKAGADVKLVDAVQRLAAEVRN